MNLILEIPKDTKVTAKKVIFDFSKCETFDDLLEVISNSSQTKVYKKRYSNLLKILAFLSIKNEGNAFSASSKLYRSCITTYNLLFNSLEYNGMMTLGSSYRATEGSAKGYCKRHSLCNLFTDEFAFKYLNEAQKIVSKAAANIKINPDLYILDLESVEIYKNMLRRVSKVNIITNEVTNLVAKDKEVKIKQGFYENRVYTPITSLSSSNYDLLIDGETTNTIDITSSFAKCLSQIMLNSGLNDSNTVKFAKITQSGDFYQYVADMTGQSRSETKIAFQQFLNCDITFHDSLNFSGIMADIFPSANDFVISMKKRYGTSRSSSNGEILFDKISAFEADIVIGQITAELQLEGVPIFSKHDEIIFKASDAEFIEEFFEEVMQNNFQFYNN
jgi:hypothetical protein